MKKKFFISLLLFLLLSFVPAVAFASGLDDDAATIGVGGETKPSVSSGKGSGNVHEFPVDSAIYGYRIYLAPTDILFMEGDRDGLSVGSPFEEYAKYATYVINKTKLSDGKVSRVFYSPNEKTKFSFSEEGQTLGDFVTLLYGSSDTMVEMKDMNFYDGNYAKNRLIDIIGVAYAEGPKIKGRVSWDYPESVLSNYRASSSDYREFYETTNTSILNRNWAVSDGNLDFFLSALDVSSDADSAINQIMQSKKTSIQDEIASLLDYTISAYPGAIELEGEKLSVVIEPVFGYVSDKIAKPAIFTATQYARRALGMNKNCKTEDGVLHGVMYFYEKRSSVNNSTANYVWGTTTNSQDTKLWSLTAYNYASTLRPYTTLDNPSKLSEHGGIGIIKPDNGAQKLTLSIYADYVYRVKSDGTVELEADGAAKYNREDSGQPKGGEGTYAEGSRNFETSKGKATEVTGATLIKDEHNGLPTRYYTVLLDLSNPLDYKNDGRVDITPFVTKYGSGVIDFKDKSTSKKMEDLFSLWVKEAIENSTILKEKAKPLTNSTDVVHKGIPDMKDKSKLALLGREILNNLNRESLINFYRLEEREEWKWEDSFTNPAWTAPLNVNENITSFATGDTVDDVTKLTTKFSGNVEIIDNGTKILAKGAIPVTIGIVEDIPDVESYFKYFTYTIEDGDLATSEIKKQDEGSIIHKTNVAISPFYSGITDTNKEIGSYFVFTFDNYNKDKKYLESSSGELIPIDEIEDFLKEQIDNNQLSGNNIRTELDDIKVAINSKFNIESKGTQAEDLGGGSTTKKVELSRRVTKDGLTEFGTYAIVVEYIDLSNIARQGLGGNGGSGGSGGTSLVDMHEFELNTLENFYATPGSIVINRSSMLDPTYRLESLTNTVKILKSESSRTGAPRKNNAPILGGYDIETLLNSSGLSALNPAVTWRANRVMDFTTANGTKSTSTSHELYAISRANLGDIRKVADYSLWNVTDYKANKSISGTTAKGVLDKLGVKYDTIPAKNLTNTEGSKNILDKSGAYGTQNIITASGTGWVVKDTYDKMTRYWVYSSYHPWYYDEEKEEWYCDYDTLVDDSHWSSWAHSEYVPDTQLITTGKFLHGDNMSNSRAYDIEYKMATYTPYKKSNKKSVESISKGLDITEVSVRDLAVNKIVNRDAILTDIELYDKSETVLGVYPEVLMKYYTPTSNSVLFSNTSVSGGNWSALGDEYNGFNNGDGGTTTGDDESSISVNENYMYTIGEKVRYFNPTSFMTVELYGKGNKTNKLTEQDISGKLSSNATSTSSKVKNLLGSMNVTDSATPVILSGGAYNLNTERNLALELTSYSVDIAGTGDGVVSASNTSNELNMKEKWKSLAIGSPYSAQNIHVTFVNNTVQGLEQKLSVIVDTERNQIVENLTDKESAHTEVITTVEAAYNIYIRNGSIVNKQDIITDIANDLIGEDTNSMTPQEAKEKAQRIYEGLQIEAAILPQLESNINSDNQSDNLPNTSTQWYDEACSTLVIKKYITKISIGNINASDKLDITWGAKQQEDRNALYSDGNKAGFEYTLKMKDDKIKLPSGSEVDINQPLLQSIIKGTNFVIPDATINDARY